MRPTAAEACLADSSSGAEVLRSENGGAGSHALPALSRVEMHVEPLLRQDGTMLDADEALRVLRTRDVSGIEMARTQSWRSVSGTVTLDFHDCDVGSRLESDDSQAMIQDIRAELMQVDAKLAAELTKSVDKGLSSRAPANLSSRKLPEPISTEAPANRIYSGGNSWEDSDCVPGLAPFEDRGRWLGQPGSTAPVAGLQPPVRAPHSEDRGLRNRRNKTWRAGGLSPQLTADTPLWENPYPHTDAVYLHQEDITDDGLPPIPRAVASQQNLELVMLVKDAQHLPDTEQVLLSSPAAKRAAAQSAAHKSPLVPAATSTAAAAPVLRSPTHQNRSRSPVRDAKSKSCQESKQCETAVGCAARSYGGGSACTLPADREGRAVSGGRGEDAPACEGLVGARTRCSLFSIDVSLNERSLQTDPKRGSLFQGCLWLEQFNLQIPERLVRLARRSLGDGSDGPLLHIHLHDSGLYSGQDVLGAGTIAIKQLIDLHKNGHNHLPMKCLLEDPATGAPVLGTDGKQTVVNFSFYCLHLDTWTQPTLEDTLRACDYDKIVLRPARMIKNATTAKKKIFVVQGKSDLESDLTVLMEGIHKDSARLADSRPDSCGHPDAPDAPAPALASSPVGVTPNDAVGKPECASEGMDMAIMRPIEQQDVDKVEFYWKESLEQVMDSIPVNLLVTLMVLLDLITYLVFALGADESSIEPPWMLSLSATIVALLLAELTLRQVGMGKRFWKSQWNLFDSLVIWLSAVIILFRIIVDRSQLPGFDAVMVLRVVSRVAIGLRVLRVLINYKRARKLHGHVVKELRSTVSQNKRRYVKHGFDLDLTYITNRVIAMSAPAFGQNSSYRNDIHVVSRFLATRHYGRFFIFNLCDTYYSSDGINGNYNPCMIFNQVQRIPFEDHGPPLMVEMIAFCEEAQLWMMQDVRNVVAIHCKGGKGRTGVMAAAIILWSGHRKTALDALELFTFRRTKNYNPKLGMDGTYKHFINTTPCNQTVEGPSQIRYVHYLEAMLYSKIDALAHDPVMLSGITVRNDRLLADVPWYISFSVRCCRYPVFDSLNQDGSAVHVLGGSRDKELFVWPVRASVWGDVRVDFYKHASRDKDSKRKLAFFVIFNTSFYKGRSALVLSKARIDMLGKDTQHKLVSDRFYISLNFDQRPSADPTLEYEAALWRLVKTYASRVSYSKGDIIVAENTKRRCLDFIDSGCVEGVCYDIAIEQYMHPLGRTACEAVSIGHNNERIPAITMLGSKSVVGVSPFMSSGSTMVYRAKTPVSALQLFRRGHRESDSGTPSRAHSDAASQAAATPADYRDFDIGIENFPDDRLHEFYRGLSVVLGRRLSRIQIETIRIGDLESFNDRQSILADQDHIENLRNSAISQFLLPMNEKLLKSAKCHLKRRELKNQKMRIIILTNDILFDPEFYGPEGQGRSSGESTSANLAIDLRLWQDDEDRDLATYVITFKDEETCRGCYELISQACKRAEVVRSNERRRPFESACMAGLLEKCSIVHRLKKDESLREVSMTSSLFLICSGECRLVTRRGGSGGDGRVFNVLREGSCVGEVDFALGCSAGHYECVANVHSTVLEIPPARLHKALEHDTTLSARFFFILCLSMEIQIRTLTTHTFPGTWSSGRSRSKQVEDFRHAIQVQSAPKITRGQSLVLTSRASPKEPRMPATPSSQGRKFHDKAMASIALLIKRVPSLNPAPLEPRGTDGQGSRQLGKVQSNRSDTTLQHLAGRRSRTDLHLDANVSDAPPESNKGPPECWSPL